MSCWQRPRVPGAKILVARKKEITWCMLELQQFRKIETESTRQGGVADEMTEMDLFLLLALRPVSNGKLSSTGLPPF